MEKIYSAPNLWLVTLNTDDIIVTSSATPEALVVSGKAIGSVEANLIFD